jgi:regulator of protease activity HflC (stomatin/prohibitin superfamily)
MRDQMNHERALVQQRQRKNSAEGRRVDSRPEIALSDTLNTELREEGNGNLSIWLQEGSNIKRDKDNRSIDRANVFESLYNNYKEI